ncbi:MAG TPA: hypothetical protein VE954_14110, partial [Oligoflexus sp.]|uniref:hypothetical protein n=1 Tax=Oligoflexus sp. TaxID=1971216 RepID=UPI002D6C9999
AGFCIFTKHSNGRFKIQLYFDHQLRVMRQDTIRWGRSLTVTCWGAYVCNDGPLQERQEGN